MRSGIVALVDSVRAIREIERQQLKLETAKRKVRDIMRRQERRLESSRHVLAVARRSTPNFDPDDQAVQDAVAERLFAYGAKLRTD